MQAVLAASDLQPVKPEAPPAHPHYEAAAAGLHVPGANAAMSSGRTCERALPVVQGTAESSLADTTPSASFSRAQTLSSISSAVSGLSQGPQQPFCSAAGRPESAAAQSADLDGPVADTLLDDILREFDRHNLPGE